MRMRHRHQHGFTLVELVVAMVLGMLVLALIVGVVIDLFGSSERSAARSKAQRSSVAAAELLLSDLRAARAPHREPKFTGSSDNLRNLLLRGATPAPSSLLVHDLVDARSNTLRFYAELIQSPTNTTAECVSWEVVTSGALRRTVRPMSATCTTGAVLQQSEVMPAPRTVGTTTAGAIPKPFSYRLLVQPAPLAAAPNPDLCTTPRVTDATAAALPGATNALRRDQVMGVELDLRSFITTKVGRGDQELITSASIVSRQSQEYRYAIGCVA